MKVLFVCSAGMSSMIAVNALKKEAEKVGLEIEVNAVGSEEFEAELDKGYDCAMVAPQIRHRFKRLEAICIEKNVPCELIQPRGYSPLGGKVLLDQVSKLVK